MTARSGWRVVRRATIVAMLTVLASATGAQAFSKALWGVPYINGVNQFPLYRQLGAKIIETDLNWWQIAPKRPQHAANPNDRAFQWPLPVEQDVRLAKQFHMQMLLQIIGAPPWANGGHPWNWAPRPSAYATFAATAAKKYPSVHLWMVWGEPNREPNFQPQATVPPLATRLDAAQKVAPHNYARILDAAYGKLKAVSESNLVIGGNTASAGSVETPQWIENLRLPDGRPPRMDMYGHNPFGPRVPSFSIGASPLGAIEFADLPRLAGMIDRNLGSGLPIFLSEFTIPTTPDEEFTYYVDPPVQAKWISDALRLSRHWKRISALGWIHVYDDPPVSYGGLLTAKGVRKPGFFAFARG